MAQITASLVKQLRDQTGAGMMDCKKALTESAGDLEQANDWLRKKGLAAAAKKAGRVAAEGLVGIAIIGTSGAMAEVNSETDFLARNDVFQDFVRSVADVALKVGGDVEKTLAAAFPGIDGTVSDALTGMIGKIGENMVLRRAAGVSVNEGVVASYAHNQVAPGLGKIGVLVGLESSGDAEKLMEIGKQLAMHICAAQPSAVSRDEVDPAQVRRERDILAEQARASGKPPEIIDKMVDGRLRKYYEEVVLMEQIFVIDGETKVGDFVEASGNDIGAPIKITGFARLGLGEGVEKKESDFAAEVAAQVGS